MGSKRAAFGGRFRGSRSLDVVGPLDTIKKQRAPEIAPAQDYHPPPPESPDISPVLPHFADCALCLLRPPRNRRGNALQLALCGAHALGRNAYFVFGSFGGRGARPNPAFDCGN